MKFRFGDEGLEMYVPSFTDENDGGWFSFAGIFAVIFDFLKKLLGA